MSISTSSIVVYKRPVSSIVDYKLFAIANQLYKLLVFSLLNLFFLYFYFSFTIQIENLFIFHCDFSDGMDKINFFNALLSEEYEQAYFLKHVCLFDDSSSALFLTYLEIFFICCYYAFMSALSRNSGSIVNYFYITASKNVLYIEILNVIFKI
jgi:hypothetical protein